MTHDLIEPQDQSELELPVGSDILDPSAIPFVLVHIACLGAIWTGVSASALALGIALYWLRIFAIGAGYHRYFSHRTFETSRAFQFVLGLVSESTAQRTRCGGRPSIGSIICIPIPRGTFTRLASPVSSIATSAGSSPAVTSWRTWQRSATSLTTPN